MTKRTITANVEPNPGGESWCIRWEGWDYMDERGGASSPFDSAEDALSRAKDIAALMLAEGECEFRVHA